MKCKATHCFHKNEPIDKETAVKVGNNYYHRDCYQTIQNIREIIDIWSKQVNEFVNFAALRRTIDSIVYDRKVDSEYVLFGLKYFIEKGLKLNYPQGLYYVIENRGVQNAYKAYKQKQNQASFKSLNLRGENTEDALTYKIPTKKGIADILN